MLRTSWCPQVGIVRRVWKKCMISFALFWVENPEVETGADLAVQN